MLKDLFRLYQPHTGRQFQTVPLPGSTNKNDGLYEAFHALSIQWSAAKVVSGPAEEINQHAVG